MSEQMAEGGEDRNRTRDIGSWNSLKEETGGGDEALVGWYHAYVFRVMTEKLRSFVVGQCGTVVQ